jgi:hypothetical protein
MKADLKPGDLWMSEGGEYVVRIKEVRLSSVSAVHLKNVITFIGETKPGETGRWSIKSFLEQYTKASKLHKYIYGIDNE